MTDSPKVAAARSALAEYDAPMCNQRHSAGMTCRLAASHPGYHDWNRPTISPEHLRSAIGALDAATERAERAEAGMARALDLATIRADHEPKIARIKAYREATGAGLSEAKAAVEALDAKYPPQSALEAYVSERTSPLVERAERAEAEVAALQSAIHDPRTIVHGGRVLNWPHPTRSTPDAPGLLADVRPRSGEKLR